jgi:pimeloyl-ACP methyl ester carboxylesterase
MHCLIRGIPVYYEVCGSGRPLLMLHGWSVDHHHMVEDFEPLFAGRSGWRRLYPDMPGMGQTPSADWITHQDHMLEVILEFIDQVAPGERIVLAGASYGGYLARGILHHRPHLVDGMLMVVPDIEGDARKRDVPAHRVLVLEPDFEADLGPNERPMLELLVVQNRTILDICRRVLVPAIALADHAFLERVNQYYAFSFDPDDLAEPFTAPALILTGRYDSICGYRQAWHLVQLYPRGTFAMLDRAGHALGAEQPALFRSLTSEWLDRVEEQIAQRA